MRHLLSEADIAERLAVEPAWLRRRRKKLYELGFPQPLPLPGLLRWDPAALDLWLDKFLRPSAAAPRAPALPANDLAQDAPVIRPSATAGDDDGTDYSEILRLRARAIVYGDA